MCVCIIVYNCVCVVFLGSYVLVCFSVCKCLVCWGRTVCVGKLLIRLCVVFEYFEGVCKTVCVCVSADFIGDAGRKNTDTECVCVCV